MLRIHSCGFLACVILSLLAACRESTSPDNWRYVQMHVSADPTSVRPSDSVFIRLVVRNPTADSIVFRDQHDPCPISVTIHGPGTVNEYSDMRLCEGPGATPPMASLALAPGDSIVGSGWWPGETLTSSSLAIPGTVGPAPPGTYFAVGYIWWDLRHREAVDSARITVVPH